MALIGMDVEAANGHSQHLQTQGIDAITNAITSIESVVNGLMDAWKGTDATNFQSDWNSSLKPNLNTVHTSLVDYQTKLKNNIQEQINTSAT